MSLSVTVCERLANIRVGVKTVYTTCFIERLLLSGNFGGYVYMILF